MRTAVATPATDTTRPVEDSVPQESPPATNPILVATDASPGADAAFTAARLLAFRSGAPVVVLAVLEPAALELRPPYPLVPPLDGEPTRMDQLRERACRQLQALVGDATGWLVETEYGDPAPAIQRVARERGVDLVVMGVSRHDVADRIFGAETTARVAQMTTAPLLAVESGFDRLPRTVVVAIGPDSPAVPGSATVRTLLSEVETVHFVNARSGAEPAGSLPPLWDSFYLEDIRDARERVKNSIQVPGAASRDLVTVAGNAARGVLGYATDVKADLIVVGQRSRRLLPRWMNAGLAARLIRGTTCSILVLPRSRKPRRGAPVAPPKSAGRTETIIDREVWPARLDNLSRRNRGRHVLLEVDDADLGAQAEASDYPFLGMDYDRNDDRMVIMLGDPAGGTVHLTHSVDAPIAVDILEGTDGRTVALRVENERGQALIRFLT